MSPYTDAVDAHPALSDETRTAMADAARAAFMKFEGREEAWWLAAIDAAEAVRREREPKRLRVDVMPGSASFIFSGNTLAYSPGPDDRNAAEIIADAARPRIEAAADAAEAATIEAWRTAWHSKEAERVAAQAEVERLTEELRIESEAREQFSENDRHLRILLSESEAEVERLEQEHADKCLDLIRAADDLAAAEAEHARREQTWELRHSTQLAQVKRLQEMLEEANAETERNEARAEAVLEMHREDQERIKALEAERDAMEAQLIATQEKLIEANTELFNSRETIRALKAGMTRDKIVDEAMYTLAHNAAIDAALSAYVSAQSCPQWARQSRAYRAIEVLRRGEATPDYQPGRVVAEMGVDGQWRPTPDPDGWIEWTGEGEPPSGMVEYRRRAFIGVESDRSDFLTWAHTGGARDIIAYRPASPQPAPINHRLACAKRDEPDNATYGRMYDKWQAAEGANDRARASARRWKRRAKRAERQADMWESQCADLARDYDDLDRVRKSESATNHPRPITDAMVEAACLACPFVGPERIRAALEAAERARE